MEPDASRISGALIQKFRAPPHNNRKVDQHRAISKSPASSGTVPVFKKPLLAPQREALQGPHGTVPVFKKTILPSYSTLKMVANKSIPRLFSMKKPTAGITPVSGIPVRMPVSNKRAKPSVQQSFVAKTVALVSSDAVPAIQKPLTSMMSSTSRTAPPQTPFPTIPPRAHVPINPLTSGAHPLPVRQPIPSQSLSHSPISTTASKMYSEPMKKVAVICRGRTSNLASSAPSFTQGSVSNLASLPVRKPVPYNGTYQDRRYLVSNTKHFYAPKPHQRKTTLSPPPSNSSQFPIHNGNIPSTSTGPPVAFSPNIPDKPVYALAATLNRQNPEWEKNIKKQLKTLEKKASPRKRKIQPSSVQNFPGPENMQFDVPDFDDCIIAAAPTSQNPVEFDSPDFHDSSEVLRTPRIQQPPRLSGVSGKVKQITMDNVPASIELPPNYELYQYTWTVDNVPRALLIPMPEHAGERDVTATLLSSLNKSAAPQSSQAENVPEFDEVNFTNFRHHANNFADTIPVLVNHKQYHRILKRRATRARMEMAGILPLTRQKYLHESRHQHALKRKRLADGRFDANAVVTEKSSTSSEPTSSNRFLAPAHPRIYAAIRPANPPDSSNSTALPVMYHSESKRHGTPIANYYQYQQHVQNVPLPKSHYISPMNTSCSITKARMFDLPIGGNSRGTCATGELGLTAHSMKVNRFDNF